jgi:hypothetical protein
MKWVTAEMIQGIAAIPGIRSVMVHPPGGDVDTDNLYVEVTDSIYGLWVKGFDPEDDVSPDKDASNCEVPMAELSDGMDSRGGLNVDSEETALAYVRIRKYLSSKGLEVVSTLKEYF